MRAKTLLCNKKCDEVFIVAQFSNYHGFFFKEILVIQTIAMLKNYCCGPEKWRYFNLEEKWWFVHIEGLLDNLVNISLKLLSLAVI